MKEQKDELEVIKSEIQNEYKKLLQSFDLKINSLNNDLIKFKNNKQAFTKKTETYDAQREQKEDSIKERQKTKETLNQT